MELSERPSEKMVRNLEVEWMEGFVERDPSLEAASLEARLWLVVMFDRPSFRGAARHVRNFDPRYPFSFFVTVFYNFRDRADELKVETWLLGQRIKSMFSGGDDEDWPF